MPVTLFCIRFLIFFGLALVPWPGLPAACNGCFRAVVQMAFHSKTGLRSLEIEPHDAHDTRIVIVNRALMRPDGSGPVRNLDLDSFDFTWRPGSLLLALILASPVSWSRRAWALVLGGVWLQAFLLSVLGFAIWEESTEVALVTLSPFWKQADDNIMHLLVGQLNIAAPFLIWLVVTFRRQDFREFLSGSRTAQETGNK
jgi:hypothetical protein